MKSKEYADNLRKELDMLEKYIERGIMTIDDAAPKAVDAISETVYAVINEMEKIAKDRHVKFDSAFHSILLEQNRKWKAICRIVNTDETKMFGVQEDLFMKIMDVPEGFQSLFTKYGRK